MEIMVYFLNIEKEIPKGKEKRVMIVGMPGIGSVGKLCIEYMIDVLKPQKTASFYTKRMPVFSYIDSSNIMRLPEISVYQKKIGSSRIFFLSGDFQPLNEEDMFDFCSALLQYAKDAKITEIITTGGIGLPSMPEHPKIFAATSTKMQKKVEKAGAITNVHGVISTIGGVTGLLPILAQDYKINCYAILVETAGIIDSISLASSRNLIVFLNKLFDLKINLKRLDDEMKDNTKIAELERVPRGGPAKDETSYIG